MSFVRNQERVSDHWPGWAEFQVDRDGVRGPVEHGIAIDSGQDVDAQACTATGPLDRAAGKTGSGPGCLSGRRSM